MKAVDVAIVGGGAVGAACARAAALRGLEVAIFEPGPDPAAASPASAGMLAAQIEPGDDVLVALSVRARDLYEPLGPALRETTGIDIGFWRSGIAAVAFDDPAADRLKEEVARQRQAVLLDAKGDRAADTLYASEALVVANARVRLGTPRFAGVGLGGRATVAAAAVTLEGRFAWVLVDYRWVNTERNQAEAGRATFVCEQKAKGWRIVHVHSSQLLP